jgi:hypothetical protein
VVLIYVPTPKRTPREYSTDKERKEKAIWDRIILAVLFGVHWSTVQGPRLSKCFFKIFLKEFLQDLDSASGSKVILKNHL